MTIRRKKKKDFKIYKLLIKHEIENEIWDERSEMFFLKLNLKKGEKNAPFIYIIYYILYIAGLDLL